MEQDQDEPMSETQAPAVDHGPLMVFDAFAKTLRPRQVKVPSTSKPGTMTTRLLPGEPGEVWLKLLKIRFGKQKLTLDGWRSALRALHAEPAWKG